VFLELMPPSVGFLIMAVMRLQFVTKEAYSVGNLFSGIVEIFQEWFKGAVDTVKQSLKKQP
jgi:hypothetical protein